MAGIDGREGEVRNPLQILEKCIQGGLGTGNIGVVAARQGVGKTAFLVGIAIDELLRGRRILHVALDQPVEKARHYFDEVFKEVAHARKFEEVWRTGHQLERNRRIHSYLGNTFSMERLSDALDFMGNLCDFHPDAVMIDGYDLSSATAEDMTALRNIAERFGVEIWISANIGQDSPIGGGGIPEPVAGMESFLDVIVVMEHDGERVRVNLMKSHGNAEIPDPGLSLDPATMLLT